MSSPVVHTSDTWLPYVVGAIGGVIGLFTSGFLKEFFDERARVAKHKRNVARHVLGICIEASTNNFLRAPRDMEDIYGVLTDLEGIDKDMEIVMNNFVNLWGRMIDVRNKENPTKEDNKHFAEMLKEIEEKRKILTAWANKVRVGESLIYRFKKYIFSLGVFSKKGS